MSIRYGSRSRPGTMVSTWLNGLVSGTVLGPGAVYFAGGLAASALGTLDKFSFLDDSRTTLSATLPNPAYDGGGCGNANVAGYYMGGKILSPYGTTAIVQKLDFSADTTSALGTGLSAASQSFGAMANNAVAGYTAGGTAGGGTVDKFAFSDDSRTTLGTGLSTAADQTMAMANSGTAGYVALGSTGGGRVTTVDKFAFSDDSRTTLGTGTSVAGGSGAGLGNKDVAGYMCQGYSTAYIATVDKFAFPSDSRSTIASRATGSAWLGGGSNSGTAGYIGGGERTGGTKADTVDKLDYSADTWSVLSTGLVAATAFGPAGIADSTSLL